MSIRRDRTVRLVLATATLIAFLLPLAWTALASLGLLPDNSSRPPSWRGSLTFDHFGEIGVAEPAFWQELATSTASAACAAALAVAVSFLGAYCLARSSFRGTRTVTQGFLVLASLPVIAYVIPLSDLMRRVHLLDTFVGVVLSEAAVTAPLAVFVLHGAIAQLPTEWEEAAVLDGAGLFRVVGRVVLPLVAPSVVATGIVLFVLDWNMLLVPLVLTSGDIKTIPLGLSDFFTFERELEWPTAAAALMVSLAPVALLVAIFHRVLGQFTLDLSARA
jgi:ABC-type glycerol-3-phosphate transport system permease component